MTRKLAILFEKLKVYKNIFYLNETVRTQMVNYNEIKESVDYGPYISVEKKLLVIKLHTIIF